MSSGVRFKQALKLHTVHRSGDVELNIFEKFCPVCKNLNDREALVCRHCGALLEKFTAEAGGTTRNAEGGEPCPEEIRERPAGEYMVPPNGIAIFMGDSSSPAFFSAEKEFIIGRKVEATSENILDFSNLGGYLLGLSRRHARIRRIDSGYEIVDLASTNGTWLNGERLPPLTEYLLHDGDHLRVGKLDIIVRL